MCTSNLCTIKSFVIYVKCTVFPMMFFVDFVVLPSANSQVMLDEDGTGEVDVNQ